MKRHLAAALVCIAPFAAWAQQVLPLNAAQAEQALARGAVVLDVRGGSAYGLGHLPGAVSAPEALSLRERAELQTLVSERGADLSREVLVVGEAGDAAAMRFAHWLAHYASGRVTWLVGGVTEWQQTGRPLSREAHSRAAVPQYLTLLASDASKTSRMAGQALRDAASEQPRLLVQVAASAP